MGVRFSEGSSYLFNEVSGYDGAISEVNWLAERGKHGMWEFKVIVFNKKKLKKGKTDDKGNIVESSFGKELKAGFFASGTATDGEPEFAKKGFARNAWEIMAKQKGLKVDDPTFELPMLKGALIKFNVINSKDEKYTNIDVERIFPPDEETAELFGKWKAWRKEQKSGTGKSVETSKPTPKPVEPEFDADSKSSSDIEVDFDGDNEDDPFND